MPTKLQFHPKLYLGESIKTAKLDKIKKKLERYPLLSGVFVITLSRNSSDQLDIYDAKMLWQKYYRNNPPFVVGIASNRGEAIEVVERIVTECVTERGDCSIKEYLQCLI